MIITVKYVQLKQLWNLRLHKHSDLNRMQTASLVLERPRVRILLKPDFFYALISELLKLCLYTGTAMTMFSQHPDCCSWQGHDLTVSCCHCLPVYSGKQMVKGDLVIFSANRSFLLRKRIIDVSVNHLLLQIESNSFMLSIIRFWNRKKEEYYWTCCWQHNTLKHWRQD